VVASPFNSAMLAACAGVRLPFDAISLRTGIRTFSIRPQGS